MLLNGATGTIRWEQLGRATGLLTGDWDDDGETEIFVSMADSRLLCLSLNGRVLWSAHLASSGFTPRKLVRAPGGGRARSLVLLSEQHAVWLVHGPRRFWAQEAQGLLQATPAVADLGNGTSLIIEVGPWGDGVTLRAFDARTGLVAWSAAEKFTPNRGVAVGDLDGNGELSVIGVGQKDGKLHLLSYRAADGTPIRASPLGIDGWLSATPVLGTFRDPKKRDVVFSTWDNKSIRMVDGSSGEVLWEQATQSRNMGGVTAADIDGDSLQDVLAFSYDANVYALKGSTGAPIWTAKAGAGGLTPPAVKRHGARTYVAVVDQAGDLFVLDGATGVQLWQSFVAGGYKPSGSPVFVERGGEVRIIAPLGEAGAVAFDLATGTELWRAPEGNGMVAAPLLATLGKTQVVFAGTVDGNVVTLDAWTGQVMRRQAIGPGLIEGDPVLVRNQDEPGVIVTIQESGMFFLRAEPLAGLGP